MSHGTANHIHTMGFDAMYAWCEAVKVAPVLVFHIGKVGYTDRGGEVLRLSVMLAGDWDEVHQNIKVARRCINGLQKLFDREGGNRPV